MRECNTSLQGTKETLPRMLCVIPVSGNPAGRTLVLIMFETAGLVRMISRPVCQPQEQDTERASIFETVK